MFMDHVTLHHKIKEFENRIRKWRQLRFGFAEPIVLPRRSASQDPRKANTSSTSVQCSPAHRLPVNTIPVGCRTSPMARRGLGLDFGNLSTTQDEERRNIDRIYQDVQSDSGKLTVKGETRWVNFDELKYVSELGNGSCGQVNKYKLGDIVMAVKHMVRTNNTEDNKRISMDLNVITKTGDCPNIVLCYGYFFHEYQVYVCMELMATCLDRLLKRIKRGIPEKVIGKMAVSILSALDYLKDKHNVIHRDIKPSNILIDWEGTIKLCDFGISGKLIESRAYSRQAGCPPYMAPERLSPQNINNNYDIRSDVWSFGITLVELATGRYPYTGTEFEMLSKIIESEPPSLKTEDGFSKDFCDFVSLCLKKEVNERPKYKLLLDSPFIRMSRADDTDVGQWFRDVMEDDE